MKAKKRPQRPKKPELPSLDPKQPVHVQALFVNRAATPAEHLAHGIGELLKQVRLREGLVEVSDGEFVPLRALVEDEDLCAAYAYNKPIHVGTDWAHQTPYYKLVVFTPVHDSVLEKRRRKHKGLMAEYRRKLALYERDMRRWRDAEGGGVNVQKH